MDGRMDRAGNKVVCMQLKIAKMNAIDGQMVRWMGQQMDHPTERESC